MADPYSRRVTKKLKSPVTRDSFVTWDMNHRSFCRQFKEWLPFLPGGTRTTWTSSADDPTRGITVMKLEDGNQVIDEDKTNETRSALEEFLRCLGTYSPEHYMGTIMQEATSYQWVLDRIQESFNLNTKGVQCPVPLRMSRESRLR